MKKRKQLDSLKTIAQSKETRWQRHVSDQLKLLQVEEQRLEQLNQYAHEYQSDGARQGSSQSMFAMRSQRQFVDRLRDAVHQQQQTVQNKRSATHRDVEFWKAARAKRMAIQKYAHKQEQIEDKHKERRAQKFLDEIGRNGRGKTNGK